MLALRYAAVLALVFWVGGLVALGTMAAPAAFDVLGTQPQGRALAGSVFGETLRRFHLGTYASGAVLIVSLAARAVLGPRPRPFAFRMALAVLMTSVTMWSGMFLSPRIEALRLDSRVAPSALPENDPRRGEFGRLHGLSSSVLMVPLLGGLILLLFELKD